MAAGGGHRRRVAIACQGGGSHTAFTAGVLDRLLEADPTRYDVVELSGTSGGALCAFAAWVGLASAGRDEGRPEARRLLERVWDDMAADDPADAVANALGVGVARAQGRGVPVPTVSPYDSPAAAMGRRRLRRTLEAVVDPETLAALVAERDPATPRLDVGAVDVQRGTFRTFTERDVTHDAVLASAAVPPLFRAAPVTDADGSTRYYWDGLFSQNPPLGDLVGRATGRHERADELWVIQINPQRRERLPRRVEEIGNRRNELGGNLSVNQELRALRRLNQWHAEGHLDDVYRPLAVKTVDLDRAAASPDRPLDYATKLDRSPAFLDRLWQHGREQADRFLAVEADRRTVRETTEATWSGGDPSTLRDRATPAFRARLSTSIGELVAFLGGTADPDPEALDADAYAEAAAAVREAVADLQFDIEETVAQPGSVALRWTATGTLAGPLASVDTTDREVTLSGVRIDHLDDGRLDASWTLVEQWGLLRQAGLVDAPDAPDAPSTTGRVAATPVVTQLSAPVENTTVARTDVAAVWNDGDRAALDRVLADDYVLHLDGVPDVPGRDAYWAFVDRYRTAFPDLRLDVEDTVAEGDKVVLRLRLRGTHEGPFLGLGPTGRAVDVERIVVHHLDDGRIVETGIAEDLVGLLRQLEVGPEAVGPSPS